jgi:hypothetical protein
MSLSNAVSNKPLSKRQRRMLQDMGIDVFTTRQVASPELHDENPMGNEAGKELAKEIAKETGNEVLPSASDVSPLAAARTALMTDAGTPPGTPPNIPEAGEPSQDAAESSSVSSLRIELNVVATSSMVHLGEVPLSAQELRFLQDLASALHWGRAHSALNDKLRNTEFRWPIVEAAGTPERAVAVFCQKHQMLSGEMPVLITPAAQAALTPWISAETSHWIVVETLSDVSSHGVAKRALWQQVMQCLGASKSTKRSVTDSP